MKSHADSGIDQQPRRALTKWLAWTLPLFFLAKGLLWLVVPVLYAMYGLD